MNHNFDLNSNVRHVPPTTPHADVTNEILDCSNLTVNRATNEAKWLQDTYGVITVSDLYTLLNRRHDHTDSRLNALGSKFAQSFRES